MLESMMRKHREGKEGNRKGVNNIMEEILGETRRRR